MTPLAGPESEQNLPMPDRACPRKRRCPQPSRRPRWPRTVLLTVVVAAVGLTACGGSAATTAAASASVSPGTAGTGGGAAAPPGVAGTVAAVTGSTLEVRSPRLGQVSVLLTGSTTLSEVVAATVADLAVGDCVTALGTPATTGGALAATRVTISFPVNGHCHRAGLARRGSSSRRRGSHRGGAHRRGHPGHAVFGDITSLSANTLTVSQARQSGTTVSHQVTLSSATTYLRVITVAPSAVAVGECIVATGPQSNTGAVTATAVTIRASVGGHCGGSAFGGGAGSGG